MRTVIMADRRQRLTFDVLDSAISVVEVDGTAAESERRPCWLNHLGIKKDEGME
jgi:hypothetical protein